jgi:D-aminoacyl-tRNA deacylase
MKVALVSSRQDPAGRNIRHHIEALLEGGRGRWREETGRTYAFVDVDGRLIHAEGIDAATGADLVIFLSRHSSVNPLPVLTVHATGNFGPAELGGSTRTLAPAAPAMMHATLRCLARYCPGGYRVSYEVTHHGPTALSLPSFFAEIGSTQKEWDDPAAGRAVAESILSAAPQDPLPLIGFGGTHYAVRQTGIALASRGAFGHIAGSLRQVPLIDERIIRDMVKKSGAVAAYVDRKALDHEGLTRLSGMLDALGILRLSESEILSIGHLPWDTYCAARAMADEVLPGARCHVHRLEGTGRLCRVRVDPVLLAEAARADEPGLLRNLDRLPVVHLSTRDNRLLPDFITFDKDSPQIINDLNTLCVKIIRSKEITATENDQLIIRKMRFDPLKARQLGIPPGPHFRQLAEGRQVEINGRLITPEMVSSCSEIVIHIPGLETFP